MFSEPLVVKIVPQHTEKYYGISAVAVTAFFVIVA